MTRMSRIFDTLVIDRCARLSWAIGTKSLRHPLPPNSSFSAEGRNPEGKGGTNHTQTPPTTKPRFSYLGVPAPAGMDDRYENRLPPPVSSFQRKRESRRGGVGDRDEDVDDGAAPVGTNAAACLLGPWLGTSPSATFLPLHRQHANSRFGEDRMAGMTDPSARQALIANHRAGHHSGLGVRQQPADRPLARHCH